MVSVENTLTHGCITICISFAIVMSMPWLKLTLQFLLTTLKVSCSSVFDLFQLWVNLLAGVVNILQ